MAELLKKVIEIQPNHADAHNNLGAAFKELGEYEKSITYFQKAIEIQPNYDELIRFKGYYHGFYKNIH